jgi:two-component system, NarL family, sensor histidine kinase DesK
MADRVRPGDPRTASDGDAVRDVVLPRPEARAWPVLLRALGLLFLAYPVAIVIGTRPGPLDSVLALAATAIFGGLIVLSRRSALGIPTEMPWLGTLGVAAVTLIAVVLSVREPEQGWYGLFYFASAGASGIIPPRRAPIVMIAIGIAAAVTVLTIGHDPWSAVLEGASVTAIGLLVLSGITVRRTNRALVEARHELARMAVADERVRIARDLHDTLGHSLSVIALKSELAGRLLPDDPDRARTEIADVEKVARESLAAVRETVSGYRRPTLEAELAAANRALDAARIVARVENDAGPLPEAVDAVLAWTIREAVTNVIRHSGASEVAIRVSRERDWAAADIVDNGRGAREPAADGVTRPGEPAGAGLLGLTERIQALGGSLEAGSPAAGGFRLDVRLPLDSTAA